MNEKVTSKLNMTLEELVELKVRSEYMLTYKIAVHMVIMERLGGICSVTPLDGIKDKVCKYRSEIPLFRDKEDRPYYFDIDKWESVEKYKLFGDGYPFADLYNLAVEGTIYDLTCWDIGKHEVEFLDIIYSYLCLLSFSSKSFSKQDWFDNGGWGRMVVRGGELYSILRNSFFCLDDLGGSDDCPMSKTKVLGAGFFDVSAHDTCYREESEFSVRDGWDEVGQYVRSLRPFSEEEMGPWG